MAAGSRWSDLGQDDDLVARKLLDRGGNIGVAAVGVGRVEEAQAVVVVAVEQQAGERVRAEPGLVGTPPPPMVPVPIARRLVRMPVWPSVTSSCAENLREGVSKARTEASEGLVSHAALSPVAVLRRKSLLSMAHLLGKRILQAESPGQPRGLLLSVSLQNVATS